MSDITDDIKQLLVASGKMAGQMEAVVKSVDRIESRVDSIDISTVKANIETHERITRHRKDMEARVEAKSHRMATHLDEVESRLLADNADLKRSIQGHEVSITTAKASWKTVVFIGSASAGLAGLMVGAIEFITRMRP